MLCAPSGCALLVDMPKGTFSGPQEVPRLVGAMEEAKAEKV